MCTEFAIPEHPNVRLATIHKVPPRYLTGVVKTVDEIIDRMMGKTDE